jgi:hypothetical protein
VSISWDAAPGAGSYKLRRAVDSGGPYATIATTANTSFEDVYAVNGTAYFYNITALNAHGESVPSSWATAIPSAAVTYPAEYETFGGGAVFEDKNDGFNDTGYVNSASTDSYLQFNNVDAGGGGGVTLRFRNALGNTDRTGRLIVNGVTNHSFTFAGTGSWTNWVNKDIGTTLNPGTANYVRLETIGQDLANIDELTVLGTAVTPPPASPGIDHVQRNGGDLVFGGFGGLPFDTYHVMISTNLQVAPGEWIFAETNQLDANGVFAVTNAIDPNTLQQFFKIQVP